MKLSFLFLIPTLSSSSWRGLEKTRTSNLPRKTCFFQVELFSLPREGYNLLVSLLRKRIKNAESNSLQFVERNQLLSQA